MVYFFVTMYVSNQDLQQFQLSFISLPKAVDTCPFAFAQALDVGGAGGTRPRRRHHTCWQGYRVTRFEINVFDNAK